MSDLGVRVDSRFRGVVFGFNRFFNGLININDLWLAYLFILTTLTFEWRLVFFVNNVWIFSRDCQPFFDISIHCLLSQCVTVGDTGSLRRGGLYRHRWSRRVVRDMSHVGEQLDTGPGALTKMESQSGNEVWTRARLEGKSSVECVHWDRR